MTKQTAIARNTMGGERPRNADDAYYTPQALADAICRRLRETIGEIDLAVEPSAGAGVFVRAARATWPEMRGMVAIEPNAPEKPDRTAPYVSWHRRRWEDYDGLVALRDAPNRRILILGNPPYDLPEDSERRKRLPMSRRGEVPVTAERHVRLALDRLGDSMPAPGGVIRPHSRWIAFLLRQSFAATPGRHARLFAAGALRYRWTVVGRPSFTGGSTDSAEYEVFVWQAGYRGAYAGGWLTWRG